MENWTLNNLEKIDEKEIQSFENQKILFVEWEKFSQLDAWKDSVVYRGWNTILKKYEKHISLEDLEKYNQSIKDYKNFLSWFIENYDFSKLQFWKILKNLVQNIQVSELKEIFSSNIESAQYFFSKTAFIPWARFSENSAAQELRNIKNFKNLYDWELKKILDFLKIFIQNSIRIFLSQHDSKITLDPVNIKIFDWKIYITDIADSIKYQFLPNYKTSIYNILNEWTN